MTRSFGWVRDSVDHRDYSYSSNTEIVEFVDPLPDEVSLSAFCSPIQDQKKSSSCVAHAVCGALEYLEAVALKQEVEIFQAYFQPISRLFVYYNARKIDGNQSFDQGAQIRNAIMGIRQNGICRETLWPFDLTQICTEPSSVAYLEAIEHKILYGYSLDNKDLNALKTCLACGYPFVFGADLCQSFMSDEVEKTGIIPMPSSTENFVGGHAMLCVGYNDLTKQFLIRNSWGEEWGLKGYAWMPYEYLTNRYLCSDAWTLRRAELKGGVGL